MASPDNEPPYKDASMQDEISLADMLLILLKRKILIAVIITIFFCFGLAYALSIPPEYESRAIIDPGGYIELPRQAGSTTSFESCQRIYEDATGVPWTEITAETIDSYVLQRVVDTAFSGGANDQPYVFSVSFLEERDLLIQVNTPIPENLIQVATRAPSPEASAEYARDVAQDIIVELNGQRAIFREVMDEQLLSVQEQIALVEPWILLVTNNDGLLQESDLSLYMESGREVSSLFWMSFRLEDQKNKLAGCLAHLTPQDARLVPGRNIQSHQLEPKFWLLIATSLFIGVVAAIVAAFFAEFVARMRQELRTRSRA